jgi:hypothetical protein
MLFGVHLLTRHGAAEFAVARGARCDGGRKQDEQDGCGSHDAGSFALGSSK